MVLDEKALDSRGADGPARPPRRSEAGRREGADRLRARLQAELIHLRAAYDQLSANATRSSRSLAALTSSLTASEKLTVALRGQRDALQRERDTLRADIVKRPAGDPARLKLMLRDEQKRYADDVVKLQKAEVIKQ